MTGRVDLAIAVDVSGLDNVGDDIRNTLKTYISQFDTVRDVKTLILSFDAASAYVHFTPNFADTHTLYAEIDEIQWNRMQPESTRLTHGVQDRLRCPR